MSKKSYPGVNIQWPISELILSKEKTVETRTYPLPEKYLNQQMVLIETPGSKGKFKTRVKAIIIFTNCFKYKNKQEFKADVDRHKVEAGSLWDWNDKPKWGWTVNVVKIFTKPVPLEKRTGIKFSKDVRI